MKPICSAASAGSSTSSLMKVATFVIAYHAKSVRLLRACAHTSGAGHVYQNLTVAFLDGIGSKTTAYRRTRRGSVDQVEAAVVLGAFDLFVLHQPVREMHIAVRAQPVRGIEVAVLVSVDRVSLLSVIEPFDIGCANVGGGANSNPTLLVRIGDGGVTAFAGVGFRLRELSFYMISGIFHLLENGRQYFTPGCKEARIRCRAVVFHSRMQLPLPVVGHEWKHVVLYVVVHIPVEIPVDRIHIHRPAIETVIENILSQASMLGETVNHQQPGPEEVREAHHEQWKEAVCIDCEPNDDEVDGDVDARVPIYLAETPSPE